MKSTHFFKLLGLVGATLLVASCTPDTSSNTGTTETPIESVDSTGGPSSPSSDSIDSTDSSDSTDVPDEVPVESLTLSSATLSLRPWETSTLTATVGPEDATDKTVAWTSSNTEVATVSDTGVVTALAVGTATVTAKAGEVSATCEVTVTAPASEDIQDPSAGVDEADVNLYLANDSYNDFDTATFTVKGQKGSFKLTEETTAFPEDSRHASWQQIHLDLHTYYSFTAEDDTQSYFYLASASDIETITFSDSTSSWATPITFTNIEFGAQDDGTYDSYLVIKNIDYSARPYVYTSLQEVANSYATVSVNKTNVSLGVGETAKITGTSSIPEVGVTYTSADSDIATVDADGTIHAVKAGCTTITVRANESTQTVNVAVSETEGVKDLYDRLNAHADEYLVSYKAQYTSYSTYSGAVTSEFDVKANDSELYYKSGSSETYFGKQGDTVYQIEGYGSDNVTGGRYKIVPDAEAGTDYWGFGSAADYVTETDYQTEWESQISNNVLFGKFLNGGYPTPLGKMDIYEGINGAFPSFITGDDSSAGAAVTSISHIGTRSYTVKATSESGSTPIVYDFTVRISEDGEITQLNFTRSSYSSENWENHAPVDQDQYSNRFQLTLSDLEFVDELPSAGSTPLFDATDKNLFMTSCQAYLPGMNSFGESTPDNQVTSGDSVSAYSFAVEHDWNEETMRDEYQCNPKDALDENTGLSMMPKPDESDYEYFTLDEATGLYVAKDVQEPVTENVYVGNKFNPNLGTVALTIVPKPAGAKLATSGNPIMSGDGTALEGTWNGNTFTVTEPVELMPNDFTNLFFYTENDSADFDISNLQFNCGVPSQYYMKNFSAMAGSDMGLEGNFVMLEIYAAGELVEDTVTVTDGTTSIVFTVSGSIEGDMGGFGF